MGPEPDPSTEQPKPTVGSGRGRGRHRAPSVLDGLRGLVSAALRKETSPTPASPETGQARHDAAAALEPRTARYLSGLLDEIDRISSRQYGGGIEMLIDEQPSPEREQFLAALARGCEVTIGLGRGGTGAPAALLQKIIDLVRVIGRETKAKSVLDVAGPRDRARLEELWAQAGGLRYPTPPFRDETTRKADPPPGDASGH
jgi:hypothetical protein